MPFPVSHALNAAVLHMAARALPLGFDVSPDAPSTYEALCNTHRFTGRVVVWDGESDNTIYEDREVNYAFRAWHDACHIVGAYPFTLEGERGACGMQLSQLFAVYGDSATTRLWAKWLHADCVGQAEYFDRWGAFPSPQRRFTLAYSAAPATTIALGGFHAGAVFPSERAIHEVR